MNGTTTAPADDAFSRFLSKGKDLVALLRDGALLLLATMLIAFPQKLNDVLTNAGFEEGSIVGFKWKAKLLQSDDALKNAQATIDNLQEQLKKSNEALNAAKGLVNDQALQSRIKGVTDQYERVAGATVQAQASVKSTIAANAQLVERAQMSLVSSGGWGVVMGSDVALGPAKDEVARAARSGIDGAGIYLRSGYYVTIAVTPDRAQAANYLTTAKRWRPDAYIAPMATWCRNMQPRDGYTECAGNR